MEPCGTCQKGDLEGFFEDSSGTKIEEHGWIFRIVVTIFANTVDPTFPVDDRKGNSVLCYIHVCIHNHHNLMKIHYIRIIAIYSIISDTSITYVYTSCCTQYTHSI